MRFIVLVLTRALVVTFLLAGAAAAAEFDPEFRTLGLGQAAAEVTAEGYEAFACGSNGGTPLAKLNGWTDYEKCAPDALGLHEVYAEFGRRAGQLAQRFHDEYGEELWIQRFAGTRMANFPVVLSLLFDDQGFVRGFRAVTDERAPLDDRGRAYLFRYRVKDLYDPKLWTCIEKPPGPKETGVGDMYVNEVCKQETGGKLVRVEGQFFRKPGQTGVDEKGMFLPGQYKSMTRWEVFDASLPGVEAALDAAQL